MASLQERRNKAGVIISFGIRVHKGRDPITGKQLKPYSKTWKVPEGWGERRAWKEAEKQGVLFEKQCREGFVLDHRQTFAAYAEYVLNLKERTGIKHLTMLHYRQSLGRVLPELGPMKLDEIRPQHLNRLYQQLMLPKARTDNEKARPKLAFWQFLEERGGGAYIVDKQGKRISLERLRQGEPIQLATAVRIAGAMGQTLSSLFYTVQAEKQLSSRTIMNCHLLVSAVLAEAEREMLIPFNPAHRATPPRREAPDPNYFQMEEVGRILDALEQEPLKWRTAVHLLLVSGCRRGELLGLKWEKVDWEHSKIHIDCTLLYAGDRGIYEGTPKTKDSVRTIQLPEETMTLLAEYRRWQAQESMRKGKAWQGSPYVFTGESGGAMNPSCLGNWLDRFSKRRGLPHLNPHAFRHTMTSMLFFNGVDSVSISRRLGHSSVSTTTNIYSHVMDQAEDRISGCMADLLLAVRPSHGGEQRPG